MSNQEAIGLIDSGVGGLTALKEALKQSPNERSVYLGDTTHCPYDPRPAEQVVQSSWEMVDFLLRKRIEILVIVCNTATAIALEEIRAVLPIPVVGIILPGARATVKVIKNNKTGVIDTLGVIKSTSYEITTKSKAPTIEVTNLDYPKFVPIVESNQHRSSVAKKIVVEILQALQLKGLDTLILGCTHYPLLCPVIQGVMGSHVTLIDSGAEIVGEISMLLDYFGVAHTPETSIQPREFYTTGSAKMFERVTNSWLGVENLRAQQIHLGGSESDQTR